MRKGLTRMVKVPLSPGRSAGMAEWQDFIFASGKLHFIPGKYVVIPFFVVPLPKTSVSGNTTKPLRPDGDRAAGCRGRLYYSSKNHRQTMGTYLVIAVIGMVVMAILGYQLGKKNVPDNGDAARVESLGTQVSELTARTASQAAALERQTAEIRQLTSERDVEKTNALHAAASLEEYRRQAEQQRTETLQRYERETAERAERFETQLAEQKQLMERQAETLRSEHADEKKTMEERSIREIAELKASYKTQIERMREDTESQLTELKASYNRQLEQVKQTSEKQLEALREMNRKQVEDQLTLIREQMKSTSESVLKARQEELGEQNKEQVSKIVDPLQQSLKLMKEALEDSKEKHQEALHKLDATIQANMKNSQDLGETAARLTRALTGEVKVQGNFGELKLRQLLEDLGLKDGEQFSSQAHLRDKLGKLVKDDEGKGLIPDFILHFPNKRDVVVDAKMSFTAYERYVNSESAEEQSEFLKQHLMSVRAQVDRLARKDYSKYLQEGYNKLNFVIMYIHTEGALNLALLNDGSLWREAYDKGVLILGPQTMYMNLRILELMWTQVRQLKNQEDMMKAANQIIDRTQDFAIRFGDVDSKMADVVKSMNKLKITTAESGSSIITAAKNLLRAGARENKKKKSLGEASPSVFIDADPTEIISDRSMNTEIEKQE